MMCYFFMLPLHHIKNAALMKRIYISIIFILALTACHHNSHRVAQGRTIPFEHTMQAYADSSYEYRCSLPVFIQAPAFNMHINTLANRYKNRFITHLHDTSVIAAGYTLPRLSIKDSVFTSTNRMLSVQLTYISHIGRQRVIECQSFNYNCKTQTLLNDSDILDCHQKEKIDHLIKKHLPADMAAGCIPQDKYSLNISPQGLVFTFICTSDSANIVRVLIPHTETIGISKL